MFKKIKEILKHDFIKDATEFAVMLNDKSQKIYCQKCQRLLPLFRLILKAKSVQNNCIFRFKCKCGYVNFIKKEVQ